MENIACIAWVGFDKSGAYMLGEQYHKIFGIDLYVFDPDKEIKEDVPNAMAFDSIRELKSIIGKKDYKTIVHISTSQKNPTPLSIKNFLEYSKNELDIYNILLLCRRKSGKSKEKEIEMQHFPTLIPSVDECWYYSNDIGQLLEEYDTKKTKIDINVFDIDSLAQPNESKEKDRSYGYIGRMEGFKGSFNLVKCYENMREESSESLGLFKATSFSPSMPFVYVGADFKPQKIKNEGIVSGFIWTVGAFAESNYNKIPRFPFYLHHDFSSNLIKDKANIYPRYNSSTIDDVTQKLGLAICPTLGISETWSSKKAETYISKNKDFWDMALEYVNIELIASGTPVMFSKKFAENYDPEMIKLFPELIYDSLENAIRNADKNYEQLTKLADVQFNWLKNRILTVNSIVEQSLLETIK